MSYECCGDGHAAGDAFQTSLSEFFKIIFQFFHKLKYLTYLNFSPNLLFFSILTSLFVIFVGVNYFSSSTYSLLADNWLLRDRSRGDETTQKHHPLTQTISPGPTLERAMNELEKWRGRKGKEGFACFLVRILLKKEVGFKVHVCTSWKLNAASNDKLYGSLKVRNREIIVFFFFR